MSFLAGLLPALGNLIPGVVKTIGSIFSGKPIGEAFSSGFGGGEAISDAAKAAAQGLKDQQERQKVEAEEKRRIEKEDAKERREQELEDRKLRLEEEKEKREQEREEKKRTMELEFHEAALAKKAGRNDASQMLPIMRGRYGPELTYEASGNQVQEFPGLLGYNSPRPSSDYISEPYDKVPIPRHRRRNGKRSRRGRR